VVGEKRIFLQTKLQFMSPNIRFFGV